MIFSGETKTKADVEFVVMKKDGRVYTLGRPGTLRFWWTAMKLRFSKWL